MGKSTRIVLLSITVVLAIAAFLVLWAVRPGTDNSLLEEARNRQADGLITVDNTVDSEEVKTALLSDQDFLNRLASALAADGNLQSSIAAGIDEQVRASASEEVTSYVDQYVSEHYDELVAIADAAIDAYVAENYDQLVQIVDSRVSSATVSQGGDVVYQGLDASAA